MESRELKVESRDQGVESREQLIESRSHPMSTLGFVSMPTLTSDETSSVTGNEYAHVVWRVGNGEIQWRAMSMVTSRVESNAHAHVP